MNFGQDPIYLLTPMNPNFNKVPWWCLWFHGTHVSSDPVQQLSEDLGIPLSPASICSAKQPLGKD